LEQYFNLNVVSVELFAHVCSSLNTMTYYIGCNTFRVKLPHYGSGNMERNTWDGQACL